MVLDMVPSAFISFDTGHGRYQRRPATARVLIEARSRRPDETPSENNRSATENTAPETAPHFSFVTCRDSPLAPMLLNGSINAAPF